MWGQRAVLRHRWIRRRVRPPVVRQDQSPFADNVFALAAVMIERLGGEVGINVGAPATPPAPPESAPYTEDEFDEGRIPNELVGIGPFVGEFPCAALTIDRAAELVPGVDHASVDGPCYYEIGEEIEAFWVDATDLDDVVEHASYLPEETAAWVDGRKSTDGCVAVPAIGEAAQWCGDTNTFPTLFVRTADVGFAVSLGDETVDQADYDDLALLALATDIGSAIVTNSSLPG